MRCIAHDGSCAFQFPECLPTPTGDADLLRKAVTVLRRNWPQTADQPPLADVIAHLGYRANVIENQAAENAVGPQPG